MTHGRDHHSVFGRKSNRPTVLHQSALLKGNILYHDVGGVGAVNHPGGQTAGLLPGLALPCVLPRGAARKARQVPCGTVYCQALYFAAIDGCQVQN